ARVQRHRLMRKCLWTVAVNDYYPEVCAITFPFMERYAKKIGADFRVIRERKFNGFRPNFEKFQLFELGHEFDYNILIDADFLISPEFHDVTDTVPLSHVGSHMA